MAFTRKAVSAIEGITPAQVDAIMTLHGTSMADYLPKSEVEAKVQEELKAKLGDLDLEKLKEQASKAEKLEAEIANLKLDHALDTYLAKEGAVNTKAVKALLDMTKIKFEGDTLTGHEEQIKTLKETEKWAFQTSAPGKTGMEQNPGSTGERTLADDIMAQLYPNSKQ